MMHEVQFFPLLAECARQCEVNYFPFAQCVSAEGSRARGPLCANPCDEGIDIGAIEKHSCFICWREKISQFGLCQLRTKTGISVWMGIPTQMNDTETKSGCATVVSDFKPPSDGNTEM